MLKIATIGGGPAAVSFCMQICEQLKAGKISEPIQILVFEKSGHIGHGLPYAQSNDQFILNLGKEIMEPAYGQNGTFSKWLSEKSNVDQATQFPPRHYFGEYLEDIAKALQKVMRVYGVTIHYYTFHEVDDVYKTNSNKIIIKSNENKFEVDHAVFCTGHMPSSTYYEFINQPNYRHNPWSDDSYQNLSSHENVIIAGSRLTAIDTALNIKKRNHQGKIIMASRSGLLPAVLAKEIPTYPLKYLTLSSFIHLTKSGLEYLPLDKLMDLFWKEISEAEGKTVSYNSIIKSSQEISSLQWLDQQIDAAEAGAKQWQRVLFAIYPIVPTIWSMLSLEDKKTFIDTYYSVYMTYLAAFPLENAYKIRDLVKSNQLEVYGGLTSIQHYDNKFILNLGSNQSITAEHLFNATGPGYETTNVSLYKNLLSHGLLQKHPIGGLSVNPTTLETLDSEGRTNKNLFAIGEPTRGEWLATTDMSQVANQASRVSTLISQRIISENKLAVNKKVHVYPFNRMMQPTSFFRREPYFNKQKPIMLQANHFSSLKDVQNFGVKSNRFFVAQSEAKPRFSTHAPKINVKLVH